MTLFHQMERLPVRPRQLVKAYARPYLVDWVWACDFACQAEITREEECGLITRVQVRGDYGSILGHVPLSLSCISRWSLVVEEDHLLAGITDGQTWLEPYAQFGHDWMYGISSCKLDESNRIFLSPLVHCKEEFTDFVFKPGRRFDFSVDLSSNIFTVSFEHYTLCAPVPNLASYRPFVHFSTAKIPPAAVCFLDPCD